MRAFIGIDFSSELKKEIADMQSRLRQYSTSGRWKYVDNFHLTLKFLAEINTEAVSEISRELKTVCSKMRPFTLKISELGNFPGRDNIRVLWLGLDGDILPLRTLQKSIDEVLQHLGFEREKRVYTPHVTIGQDLVFKKGFDEIKELAGVELFPQIKVDRVHLFKSEQIGNKRVYTAVAGFGLGEPLS